MTLTAKGLAPLTRVDLSAVVGVYFNPVSYGAVGDGVTADTVAAQDAIDASNGGTVFFPPGIYKLGALTISKNVRIIGSGAQYTKLIATSGQKLFNFLGVFDATGGNEAFFSLSDLTLDGAARAATNAIYMPDVSAGVHVFAGGRFIIEKCLIQNFGSGGVYAVDLGNSTYFCAIENCIFTGNEGGVRTGSNSDIVYHDVQFGGLRSLPHITTNGSSTRIRNSSFTVSGGTATTTPDILITTDGGDPGHVRIASCKFGPEGEVSTRPKIQVYSASDPLVVIPNIAIDKDNQFSGVTGQTAISIESPVRHMVVQGYFETFSKLINDAQPFVNDSTGQSSLTNFRINPPPTGTTYFTNGGRGFTVRATPGNWIDERIIKSEFSSGLINRIPDSGGLTGWGLNGVTITTGQTDPLGSTTAFLLTRANSSAFESINSSDLDVASLSTTQSGSSTGKQLIIDIDALAGSLSYMTVTLYDTTISKPIVQQQIMLKSVWDTYRIPCLGIDESHGYVIYIYPGNLTVTQAGTIKVWRVNVSDYGTAYIVTDGSGNAATNPAGSRFELPVIMQNFLIQGQGALLTPAANVITPTHPIHSVAAGNISTITVPTGFTGGTIQLYPTAAFTYDAAGNIFNAGTAVIGRIMTATYVSGKWSMSY